MGDDERQPLLPSPSVTPYSVSPEPSEAQFRDTSLEVIQRTKRRTRVAYFTVITTEGLERMAFYSLTCNMVLFLNSDPLGWMSYNAAIALLSLNGLSYIFTIFGGWLADAIFGKYRVIVFAFLIYIVGTCMWPALYPYPRKIFQGDYCNRSDTDTLWCAHNASYSSNMTPTVTTPSPSLTSVSAFSEMCSWAVFLSIFVISVGYGAVRVNIIPFGAHQVEHEGPISTRSYFNWLYWSINIGTLIAFGAMGYIQPEVSYFYGYLVPVIALVIALTVFLSASCVYTKKYEAHGSIISNIVCIVKNAVPLWYSKRRGRDVTTFTSEMHNNPTEPPSCCIDYAKHIYGGKFSDGAVNDVKAFGKVLLVFVSLIPYWTVYYQMQTTFLVQGLHMKLDFGNRTEGSTKHFQMPASWLMLFDVVFILLLLPVFDRIIYPRLDRAGYTPTLRMRIIIGMFFTLVAMVIAGVVEFWRLHLYWKDNIAHPYIQIIGCTSYYAADMSIFYQTPQYALIGISEIFTSTAGLELAYVSAPRSMKSVMMGFYWFCQGLGALLGSAMIAAFDNVWFTNLDHGDINCQTSPFTDNKPSKCRMDYYFYVLAGFQLLGIIAFLIVVQVLNTNRSIPPLRETGTRSSENRSTPITRSPSPPDLNDLLPSHIQRRNVDSRSNIRRSSDDR